MTEAAPAPAPGAASPLPPPHVEVDGDGVLHVVMRRPQRRNALDIETVRVIGEAFGERSARDDVRCVLLRGDGPVFCAGLDRGLLASLAAGDTESIEGGGAELQAALDAMERCVRPTLCAVQGAAVGGGLALALACDLRVAAEDAVFSMMEMRYGFVPDLGHVHRLQRETSLARAKEAVLLGDRLTGTTLAAWGVVNEAVPAGDLEAAVARWTARLAAAAPLAVRAAKALMQADPGGVDGARSQGEALRVNAETLLRSDDFREGVAAALEGREPRFAGR